MQFYTPDELALIVERSADVFETRIDSEGAREISLRSRGTPRIANRILKRVRDFAQVKGQGVVDLRMAQTALEVLEIDQYGLDAIDRKILSYLIEFYGGGPVGLNTLAVNIGEDTETLEDMYEPYLVQNGFIQRTPRGRQATALAYEHLGYAYSNPDDREKVE